MTSAYALHYAVSAKTTLLGKSQTEEGNISILLFPFTKTRIERDTCTPMFIIALFIIAKNGNGLNRSTDEWIKKMWYIYLFNYSFIWVYG